MISDMIGWTESYVTYLLLSNYKHKKKKQLH